MNDLKETLTEQDDAEAAVKSGIAVLMENEGIAKLVSDESDYEAVLQAARDYVEDDTDKLNSELDVRQNLYNLLRIISIVGVLAGVIGVLASLKPNRTRIYAATGAAGIAAVASLVLNIYGLSNDYRSFVYSLEDGSGFELFGLLVQTARLLGKLVDAVRLGRVFKLFGAVLFVLIVPAARLGSRLFGIVVLLVCVKLGLSGGDGLRRAYILFPAADSRKRAAARKRISDKRYYAIRVLRMAF